ncbi:MAG TPA: hypothetical protein VFZ08_07945 [Terriglobia bacterium]|nr:hypothetical protein [Terriglobia bacterium]
MSVKMTERAAQEFKNVCGTKSLPVEDTMLRIDSERNEGEKKLTLSLRLDSRGPGAEDAIETTEGARLVIDKGLEDALGEAYLDYRDDGGGFVLERAQ